MPGGGLTAYDPNNPTQGRFLAALARGESGGGTGSSWLGFGGIDLSNAPTDQYGFPLWSGVGNTHAAGTFQFQPRTWADVASRYGLDFHSPADQSAGAWYLAEETYSHNTGGRSLEQDLQSGDTSRVQSALASVWPSVTGNGANPGGLVSAFLKGGGSSSSGGSAAPGGGGIMDAIVNIVQRFGLVIIGGIIVLVALWSLLSSQGLVPSPKEVASGAIKIAAAA